MLKVLIVDDEIRVCRLIQYLIDWNSLGLEVLGYVNDGLSAFQIIKDQNPDIIITDIRMPEFGGLELIEQARNIESKAHFIIISGYSDFSYAQTAIKYGVDDYLLKPIKKKELVGTLEKIIAALQEEQKNIDQTENMRVQLNQSVYKVKNKLLHDIMENEAAFDFSLEQINKTYYSRFSEGSLQIVGIQIMHSNNINPQTLNFLNTKLQDIVLEVLSAYDEVTFTFSHGVLYCLINGKPSLFQTLNNDLLKIRCTILGFKDMFSGIGPIIALSEVMPSLKHIPDMMRQVQEALLNKLFLNMDTILLYSPRPKVQPISTIINSNFRKEFLLSIETLKYATIISLLKGLSDTLKNTLPIDGCFVHDVYNEVISVFLFGVRNCGIHFDYNDFEEKLQDSFMSCLSIHTIFELLQDRIVMALKNWQTEKALENSKPIRQAKQYIKSNFKEPLSLEILGSQIGLNPTYFSSVFKKETGYSFIDYLTEVRIQNAKELLVDTNKSVNDIAEISGFNDLKYFNKKFRKYTGLSPSEYRKLYS